MRINRHVFAMESAEVAAKRATCYRLAVGAVITLEGRIISTGYNGPPAGEEHCQGNHCQLSRSGGCTKSVHAEENAIRFLAEHYPRVDPQHLTLYVTTCPCASCAEKITAFGINRVIYRHDYRSMLDSLEFFKSYAITILKLTASGYLVDPFTQTIIND